MATAIESGRSVQEIIDNEIQYEIELVPQELARNNEIGDLLLRAIVLDNRQPTHAESVFFRGKLGLDERQLRAELSRMRQVVSKLAIVGTQKQREAAESERLAALDALANEKPKLQKKLEAIQEQIAALERTAAQAEKRSEQIELAVAELQKPELLRSDLQAAAQRKSLEFAESTWSPMNAIGIEIKHRELLLDDSHPIDQKFQTIRVYYPECLSQNEFSHKTQIAEPAWSHRKHAIQTELAEMREKFQALAAVKEQQLAELAELQGFYLRSNG